MKLAPVSVVENLRHLRSVISAYEAANSAICAAQTAARFSEYRPTVDCAAIVQMELRAAGETFRAAYQNAVRGLENEDAQYLHDQLMSQQ